ncbi:MAG: alpha/beta hydrolase-fold protein [Anaerolineales bacterium]
MSSIPLSDNSGFITRHENFVSAFVPTRHVDVWLPPAYFADESARFPVLYMHDGQNLFDPALAYTGVDWGVDETLNALGIAAIVVGAWNSSQRWRDYMPQRAFGTLAAARREFFVQHAGGEPVSDGYLRFLVEELKPFIDTHYRTLPEASHTFIMGSSMGGLISLYAIEQYPQVFGGAGCLSTHFPAGEEPLVDFLGARLPDPATHKLYFDFGTRTLDHNYEPYQRRMDDWLARAGYVQGKTCLTRKFEGHEHTESAWRARLHIPLGFLFRA